MTTIVALSVGYTKFNPLVATLVHYLGPAGVTIVTVLYIAVAGTVWRVVDGMGRLYALGAATCLSQLIDANSVAWLIMPGGELH